MLHLFLNSRKVLGSVSLSCIDIKVIKLCSFYFLTQLLRNKLVSTARKSIMKNANLGQLYRSMQDAYHEMQTPLVYQTPSGLVRIYCDPSEMLRFVRISNASPENSFHSTGT